MKATKVSINARGIARLSSGRGSFIWRWRVLDTRLRLELIRQRARRPRHKRLIVLLHKRWVMRPTRLALERAWSLRRWGCLFDPEVPF